jgi:hypothetical protein
MYIEKKQWFHTLRVDATLYVLYIVVNIDKKFERIFTTEQWRREGNSIHKAILIILGVFIKQTYAQIYNCVHSIFSL